jgi:hypothetical protein
MGEDDEKREENIKKENEIHWGEEEIGYTER